jgi:hypothetical protein
MFFKNIDNPCWYCGWDRFAGIIFFAFGIKRTIRLTRTGWIMTGVEINRNGKTVWRWAPLAG